jgi:hypothetical protein
MCEFSLTVLTKETNSTEQGRSWETNRSLSQEIPRLLWKPKVDYRAHKSPLLVPIPP